MEMNPRLGLKPTTPYDFNTSLQICLSWFRCFYAMCVRFSPCRTFLFSLSLIFIVRVGTDGNSSSPDELRITNLTAIQTNLTRFGSKGKTKKLIASASFNDREWRYFEVLNRDGSRDENILSLVEQSWRKQVPSLDQNVWKFLKKTKLVRRLGNGTKISTKKKNHRTISLYDLQLESFVDIRRCDPSRARSFVALCEQLKRTALEFEPGLVSRCLWVLTFIFPQCSDVNSYTVGSFNLRLEWILSPGPTPGVTSES